MKIVIHILLFFCIVIPIAWNAYAETGFTFRELFMHAMDGNPELRALRSSLGMKRADIGIARSRLLPQLSVEERFLRTNNPTYSFMAKLNQERFAAEDFAIDRLNNPSPVSDFQTSFSFEQALFAPQAFVGIDMASREHEAQSLKLLRKKEEVAFNVYQAALGMLTAKAFREAADRSREDAAEHLRLAEVRYDSGTGLYSDVLRARVSIAAAEEQQAGAKRGVAVARRSLGLLLGMTDPVDVVGDRPQILLRSLDDYLHAAQTRADLKAMEEHSQNAANMLRMANAGYLPTIGVGGSYQLNDHHNPFGDDGESWLMMVFLKWNLFDGARREYERVKAKYAIEEAREYLEGMKKGIAFRVHEAYLSVEEAESKVALAQAALLSAEEGRRLVMKRYENALSPLVELLDVQAVLDAARATVIEKENGYFIAVARLSSESGMLLRDLGLD